MTLDATQAVTKSAEAIKNGSISAYEKLIYGLILSGFAMQMLGNSRCASGAEHHISHLIEMQPEGLGVKSNALHGEKVGVATLLACRQYHKIKSDKNIICLIIYLLYNHPINQNLFLPICNHNVLRLI